MLTLRKTWVLLLLSAVTLSSSAIRAQDSAIDLMLQVNRMRSWLGTGPQAEGWRRYLLLNQLETQATKGWRADPQVVNMILQRFDSNAPGLQHPVFASVRNALAEHSRQLGYANRDVDAAFANAVASYSAVDEARVRRSIAGLKYEIDLARQYYSVLAQATDSPIADLKLDELEMLVNQLDFSAPKPQSPDAPN